MQLTFKINGQRVSMFAPDMVADTIGYFDAICTFTQDWDGVNKWMHLVSPIGEKTEFQLVDDKVSDLNLTEGRWEVWFHGNEMTAGIISTRIVTQTISFVVSSSEVSPDGPLPKIPLSVAEQISANAAEALRMAQLLQTEYDTLKNDAEAAVKLSQSWAAGGTGARQDEDSNNSKHFCEQSGQSAVKAEAAAGKAALAAKAAADSAAVAGLSEAAAEAAKTEAVESASASKASELLAGEAQKAAESARDGASTASISAEKASQEAQTAKAEAAESEKAANISSSEAKSWAVGGTETRPGEDTDNAKHYAEQAKESETKASTAAAVTEAAANRATDAADSASASASSATTSEQGATAAEVSASKSARAAALSETNAKASETKAAADSTSAGKSAAAAASSETAANQAKQDSAISELNAKSSEEKAGTSAITAQSWAVGGTGFRQDEDTNNARYWAEKAKDAAGGGVSSFNNRTGPVLPQAGDYTPEMVGARPADWIPAHNEISGRDEPDQHSMSAIAGLVDAIAELINKADRGVPNGVAELDTAGKVPEAQLPTGVKSFNGRSGQVVPQKGDYTAEMVCARPNSWVPTAEETNALPAAGGTMSGPVDMGNNRITGLGDGTAQTDAATKKQLDEAIAKLGVDGFLKIAELAQTTGGNTNAAMSQKAVSDELSKKLGLAAGSLQFSIGRDSSGIYIEY